MKILKFLGYWLSISIAVTVVISIIVLLSWLLVHHILWFTILMILIIGLIITLNTISIS